MSLFEQISELDKTRIANYLQSIVGTPYVPLDELLSPWESAKSEYLAKLFDNQLILKFPYEKEEDFYTIRNKINYYLLRNGKYSNFFNKIRNKIYIFNPEEKNNRFFTVKVDELFCSSALTYNKIEDSLILKDKDGKKFTINAGTKTMKVYRMLVKKLGLTDDEVVMKTLENLINDHSICLNNKKLKGDLCLSIHPLDYMTMSDNSSGWGSCMSWRNSGCHVQGTVEMMNSPCVVVGYLTSSEPYCFSYYNDDNDKEEWQWNNKKWRSLFIVDNGFVLNIRNYPYENNALTATCLEKLADMAGFNGLIHSIYFNDYNSDVFTFENPKTKMSYIFNPNFRTGSMYNDLACEYEHQIIINPAVECDYEDEYTYSGVSECMECGRTTEVGDWYTYEGADGELLCDKCNPHEHCGKCGCLIHQDDDVYYFDNTCYCYCCIDDVARYDHLNDDYIAIEESVKVFLSAGTNPDEYEKSDRKGWEDYITTSKYNFEDKEFFKTPPKPKGEDYFVTLDQITEYSLSAMGFGRFSKWEREELVEYLNYPLPKEYEYGITQ